MKKFGVGLIIVTLLIILELFAVNLPFEEGFLYHFRVGLALFIALILVKSLLILFAHYYRKRKNLTGNRQDNLIAGLNNIFNILAALSVFLYLLSILGVSPLKLLTSLSIVAAAIAIVSREFIASILAGFAISFSNVLNINDYVKIANMQGQIRDISLTKIQLLNDDDELIFIPNDRAFHGEIINFTKGNTRRVNVPFEMDSNRLDTVENLESEIINSLEDFRVYIIDNSFYLRIEEVKKDMISFKFYYTMQKLDKEVELKIRKKTVRTVINYLQKRKLDAASKKEDC